MTSHENLGSPLGFWARLGHALKHGILGRSTAAYMTQFTGNDEYWGNGLAAERGWPRELAPMPDRDQHPAADPGKSSAPAVPTVRPSPREPAVGPLAGRPLVR